MNRSRVIRKIEASSFYNYLQLELENYSRIENRLGRNIIYKDNSLMTATFYDISVTIFDSDNIVKARFELLCLPVNAERYKHYSLVNLMFQLNLIRSDKYIECLP